MASTVVVAQTEQRSRGICCFIDFVSEICYSGRLNDERRLRNEENSISKIRRNLKAVFLGLGFTCVVICFIFAAMGYLKFRTCPVKDKLCGNNPLAFTEAQNYRVAAALLFIIGICFIVAFVWILKSEGQTLQIRGRPDVVVSDVTAEGLLKTPAANVLRPFSRIHNLVYEPPVDSKLYSANDLPKYELAVKLQNEEKSSVTRDGVIIAINGVETESVCIQVDEDDINPPPSYLQALEMVNEFPEEIDSEERDTG